MQTNDYQCLSPEALAQAIGDLPGWQITAQGLHKVFTLKDFSRAFAFMTQVAMIAETYNHHPDWSNSYHRVEIYLFHHQLKCISELDVILATRIEQLLPSH
ncbi:4a-hydroxytetrahydrobiopterin dehydratase [Motilimonas pumila]|uniref:Putative pterin-4-alpha-carbinolamine dehydratase n=1 Tax=Motilimonas pumila TaxID=2303987 RepID=A0A418YGD7_9GAMM|nr:4a-hydroxytetrahydrobiopterin dehydratase [Motilimonas pumila]RJG48732.1 4a-hydroxytetrahydrobiopterin dehydratase [Motilimonas pumila]